MCPRRDNSKIAALRLQGRSAPLSARAILRAPIATGRKIMKTHYTVALAMFAGIAIGAVAVQGLHAQSKPKAYTVTEIEVIDAAAQAAYTPTIVAEIGFAGGRPVNNAGGNIVGLVGEAPKRVAINEWTSLDKAQAFYNSPEWKKLAPQRDKAIKIIRMYAVENPN
jgi:uncharacterized protein (DUF1330 family)